MYKLFIHTKLEQFCFVFTSTSDLDSAPSLPPCTSIAIYDCCIPQSSIIPPENTEELQSSQLAGYPKV